VAPDGVLNLLPFEELLPETSADVEWMRVPSAAVLARIRSAHEPLAGSAARTLVLADETGPSGRLRGIREEVADLARRYRGVELRLLSGTDSLRVEDLEGPWSILHVAAHAEVDDQRPWRSALHLGEGVLRAGTIARAHVPARLACLSSCRTSHGRVLSGEGMLGLSTALLSAGTECVVATLWPVEDRATARLMGAFYSELSAGRSVAGALQRAKRVVRENPATSQPFFWAGFVTIGAGETRIPLTERERIPAAAAGIAAAAVLPAVALAIWLRRKRLRKHVIRDPNEHLIG
jgi:CHAT domain-containing protein